MAMEAGHAANSPAFMALEPAAGALPAPLRLDYLAEFS